MNLELERLHCLEYVQEVLKYPPAYLYKMPPVLWKEQLLEQWRISRIIAKIELLQLGMKPISGKNSDIT